MELCALRMKSETLSRSDSSSYIRLMSFILTLNSTNVSNTNTNTTFKYNFINGGFTCKDYEMCISSITLPYRFFNDSSYYNERTGGRAFGKFFFAIICDNELK